MDASTIRARLIRLEKQVPTNYPLVYQALEKVAAGTNNCTLRNIAKIFFYITSVFIFKDVLNLGVLPYTKTLTFAYYDKARYKEMWKGFLTRHDQYQEGDSVIYINTKHKKILTCFPTRDELQNARMHLKRILETCELNLFQKIFTYWELVYCLKSQRFHTEVLRNCVVQSPDYFLTVGEGVIPGVFYTQHMKKQGSIIDSFQFFNLSEDHEYKVDAESVWSNMLADRYFVWGKAYKTFIEHKTTGVDVQVIGHPLYKHTQSQVRIPTEKNIIIAANPPEMKHINEEFFKVIFSFAQEYGYRISLRLHPNDQISSYSEFTSSPAYRKALPDSGVYVVNNSTVYFDLVYEQQLVMRYKHPESYLAVVEEIQDYFITTKDLHAVLLSQTERGLAAKRDVILENVLGLK